MEDYEKAAKMLYSTIRRLVDVNDNLNHEQGMREFSSALMTNCIEMMTILHDAIEEMKGEMPQTYNSLYHSYDPIGEPLNQLPA